MPTLHRIAASLLLILTTLIAQVSPVPAADSAKDAPGAHDHPLITRYPGTYIDWYEVQSFDRYKIAVGPRTGYRHIEDWVEVEGKVSRIYYVLDGDHSVAEVHLNYLQALRKAGFEILAEGLHNQRNTSGEIGGRSWLGIVYAQNALPTNGKIALLTGSSTVGGSGYVAGRLERDEGDVYVAAASAQYREDRVVVLVDVVEVRRVEDDLVTVDAAAMSDDIDKYGKVALYGISFDHDKATMKPESKPALDEIAKLLSERPQLSVYVVGHTDSQGSLQYNRKLSLDRARSVVKELVAHRGIDAHRLEAHGVGPLVPVATNHADAGRAKNRRVELVER